MRAPEGGNGYRSVNNEAATPIRYARRASTLGEVHGRHPAGADLAFNPVPVGERKLEPVEQLGHVWTLLGSAWKMGARGLLG